MENSAYTHMEHSARRLNEDSAGKKEN